MKKVLKILLLIIVFFALMTAFMFIKMKSDLKNLEYYEVNMNTIDDGIYHGKAVTSLVKVEVEVEVKDSKIIRIDILKHDNGMGKDAELITDYMIEKNTYDVDAISGATSSSEVIKSAVSKALAGID